MKTQQRIAFSLIVAMGVLLSYSGCKSNDDSGPSDQMILESLSKPWKVTSVTLDGTDQTSYYPNFVVQISGTTPTSFAYTTTNRPHYSCWPSSGLMAFGSDVTNMLIRDKGTASEVPMNYKITANTFEISFAFSGDPFNARTTSVAGQWVFVFGL